MQASSFSQHKAHFASNPELHDQPTRTWEPERLRLRLLTVAARLITTGRRRIPRLLQRWSWSDLITGGCAAHSELGEPAILCREPACPNAPSSQQSAMSHLQLTRERSRLAGSTIDPHPQYCGGRSRVLGRSCDGAGSRPG
jgi:hypothetical protein